jgi:serine protease Do
LVPIELRGVESSMRSLITILAFVVAAAAVPGGFAQTSAPQSPRSAIFHGAANRGYLGVGVVELTDERVKALNLKDRQGVEVKRVDENSPAAKVGLKDNDVILEVNGKGVDGIEQFQRSIGETSPGAKVDLTIWRNGARQTVSATLDSRPSFFIYNGPDFPVPPMPPVPFNGANSFPTIPGASPVVGFEGEALNPQLAEYFGVKEGVLVRFVTAKTPAEHAGLKAGDVVVKVNGTPVTNPREISGLVRANGNKKTIAFTVVRNKKEISLNVEIAEDRTGTPEREVL